MRSQRLDVARLPRTVDARAFVLAAWMHGIVHLLEGDASNARYWYGQARRPFPAAGTVREEIEAVRAAVDSPDERA